MRLPDKVIVGVLGFFPTTLLANGWSTYVDTANDGRLVVDPIGGYLALAALVLVLLFGWVLWGKKSLKGVYLPALLGVALIFTFKEPTTLYGYITLPVAGLLVGWLVIGLGTCLWAFSPSERRKHERPKPESDQQKMTDRAVSAARPLIAVEPRAPLNATAPNRADKFIGAAEPDTEVISRWVSPPETLGSLTRLLETIEAEEEQGVGRLDPDLAPQAPASSEPKNRRRTPG